MLEVAGRSIMNEPAEILSPAHTALIVIDLQNDFVADNGSVAAAGNDPSAIQAIVPTLQRLVAGARAAGVLVVHIQTLVLAGHRSDSDSWLFSKLKGVSSAEWCLEGTWGAEIIPELAPAPGEPVVTKFRSSSFINTNLDLILRSNGIRTVVICGEQTPGCVDATLRDSTFYDYYNALVEDAIAAYRKDLHEAALVVQRARHQVLTSDELLALWATADVDERNQAAWTGVPAGVMTSEGGRQ
jgi:ureidoacrylate peracid hydrolase